MNQQQPTEDEQHHAEERKHWATLERHARWQLFITAGGTIVGLVGLGSLWILFGTLQQAKTATEVANRAWLSPVQARFKVPNVGQPIAVEVRFINSGHEPAVDVALFIRFDTISIPPSKNILDTDQITDNVCDPAPDPNVVKSAVIPPGGGWDGVVNTDVLGNKRSWDEALDAGHTWLRAKTCATYLTFNVRHYTRSCRLFDIVSSRSLTGQFTLPGAGQGATPAQEPPPGPTTSQGIVEYKREAFKLGIAASCNGGDSAT